MGNTRISYLAIRNAAWELVLTAELTAGYKWKDMTFFLSKCTKWVKGKTIPVEAQRVPGSWASQISRQSAHEGGKVVICTHRPPLPSKEIFLFLISIRDWDDSRAIVREVGLCQWKIIVTPSGIQPATFRLAAQCLNQLRHRTYV